MGEVRVFDNGIGGKLRTVMDDRGDVWFAARDVATALSFTNTNDLTRLLDEDEKGTHIVRTPGGNQQMATVNEPGLYHALNLRRTGSIKDETTRKNVKAFQRQVNHEVLPAIRRDGAYVASDGDEDDATLMARALLAAKRAIDRKDALIAEMKPKVLFADTVAASDGTCLIGELAKMMTQAGYPIGQNRLFAKLREDGYLGKSGSNRNVPLQRYVEMGLFKIKETAITHSDGHVTISRTTKVTGKGQRYFIERYCMVVA